MSTYTITLDGKLDIPHSEIDDNRLGGRPEWAFSEPPASLTTCKLCGYKMYLLMQVAAPTSGTNARPDRYLYVMGCRKPGCTNREFRALSIAARPAPAAAAAPAPAPAPAPAKSALSAMAASVAARGRAPPPPPPAAAAAAAAAALPTVLAPEGAWARGYFLDSVVEPPSVREAPVEDEEEYSDLPDEGETEVDPMFKEIEQTAGKGDLWFERFDAVVNAAPGAVGRYGLPLEPVCGCEPSRLTTLTTTLTTPCQHCQGRLQPELQVLPTAIHHLRLPEASDWHSVIVCTCANLCAEDREWREEQVVVVTEDVLSPETK